MPNIANWLAPTWHHLPEICTRKYYCSTYIYIYIWKIWPIHLPIYILVLGVLLLFESMAGGHVQQRPQSQKYRGNRPLALQKWKMPKLFNRYVEGERKKEKENPEPEDLLCYSLTRTNTNSTASHIQSITDVHVIVRLTVLLHLEQC